MKAYEASAVIAAPPDIVWAVLTDAGSYGEWDSGATRRGADRAGERIKVTSEANPKRAFPVRVTELAPPARMTWSGGHAARVVPGRADVRLEPRGDDGRRSRCARSTRDRCCR